MAVASPAWACAQLSVVNSSSTELLMPSAVNICCLASGVLAAETMVVRGVTATALLESLGTSETNARFGSFFPVTVSVPPMDTILGVNIDSGSESCTLKNPESSEVVENSSPSMVELSFRSTKT